ncbi:MAG TPA: tyrosine-type recombinase/integrase [Planctomycetota bacterium]|nr:tyrosine-type recombinase/integrase [Planctomycetota bacterium]
MGFLFRRRRRKAEGFLRNWYVRYADSQGRWHEEAAFTDKGKSRQLLSEREEAAREGRLSYATFWRRWERLLLWDERGQSHVGAYLVHLEAKGTMAGQRERVRGHLVRAFGEMGAVLPGDVTQEAVERNLVALVASGRAAATRNHRLSALRSFWRWGLETRRFRAESDPTLGLRSVQAEAARVRARRALSIEELRRLVAAARVRPLENYLEGHPNASEAKRESLRLLGLERAILYTLAAYAGLRRRELRELCWGDLRLEQAEPLVVVRAATAKGKREENVELAPSAADALREWRAALTSTLWAQMGEGRRVFGCVGHGLLNALWADCKAAGVAITTQDGRVDLHALRHTTATLLCLAGVAVPVAQRILRHKDARTTLRIYTHVSDSVRAAAVGRMAPLSEGGSARQEGIA